MYDPLTARARTTPESEALLSAEGGTTWTYGELSGEASEAAGRLAALGVAPGDHVGVVAQPSPTYVGLVHAVARLGAVLVPLGAESTPPELSARIDAADVTALVCDDETEPAAVKATGDDRVPVVSVDEPGWDRVTALSAAGMADPSPYDWNRSERFCVLFTSGTTGTPKPVALTLGNVVASAVTSAFRLGISASDRWLVTLPLHHSGGLSPLYRSALYGSSVVLRKSFEAGPTADDIDEYDCTAVSLVPTMLRRMLAARGTLSDSLRFVLLGGAPAGDELLARCRDFSVPVCPTYGTTETASQIATATTEEARSHPGTVGRPLLWTEVTVVDGEGNPVPRGEVGELVVGGPTVTPGYYGMAEATDEAFGDRGFHTGDIGRRDEDGRLWVLNRLDDRIVTGGETVDPGAVAGALSEFDPIDTAAVVGLDDPEWGERVAALVVADDLDRDALDDHLDDSLAPYKHPKTVATADELPRTASGTVDRVGVRERLREVASIPRAEGGFDFGDDRSTDGEGRSTDGEGRSTDGEGRSTDGEGRSTDGEGRSAPDSGSTRAGVENPPDDDSVGGSSPGEPVAEDSGTGADDGGDPAERLDGESEPGNSSK